MEVSGSNVDRRRQRQQRPTRAGGVLRPHILTTLMLVMAWSWHPTTAFVIPQRLRTMSTQLDAKRNKRATSKQDADDLNRWYESVQADASPEAVFWEEMERQNQQQDAEESSNEMASTSSNGVYPSTSQATATATVATEGIMGATLAGSNVAVGMATRPAATSSSSKPLSAQSVEATLAEYATYQVADNWLDDELSWMMQGDDDEYVDQSLDDQLDDWEQSQDHDDGDDEDGEDTAWMQSDDPWDHWGESEEDQPSAKNDPLLMATMADRAEDYLYDDDQDSPVAQAEAAQLERELQERLSKIHLQSRRLERARDNPKAQAFFDRPPNELEGFDRLWVSAIDNVCFKNLIGTFRNYGIEFADNFGDWKDQTVEDGLCSIEDIASYKARQVFAVTGRPCVASRTSFEIEPVPELNTGAGPATSSRVGGGNALAKTSPRVMSGYRFNDVGVHVDYVCDALRSLSEPNRVTRFKTCLCYYDGEMEVFAYGVCDVDLVFANSIRTFIPVSQAINEMMNTLQMTFGLEYQKWLNSRLDEIRSGGTGAMTKLRDRVLKEGKVLPNDIIDVSAFMDSMVDVNLMDDCAKDLSNRFVNTKPSKILTVATTGLVLALPMAKYLQVPVVYARKERNVVMADTFKAGYSSKTVGRDRELLVSKSHIDPDDRILIVDDFLSSGASQEALLRIVSDAGATAVGVGVLLEKAYESGRQSLSGFDIPVQSLCRIASVKDGVIQLLEEEGYDRMQKQSLQR